MANVADSALKRYIQLGVLVLAAGAIYPLIYLRQNFEITIFEVYGLDATDLGQFYATLGVIFVATYVPSGWLADRVSPRLLIAFSLALTAALGVWFSTIPSADNLQLIFAGWGIATGLTFWAALIKAVAVLARHDEQGRFFGILDGGRGLVEAILATIAVALFAWSLDHVSASMALTRVIYLYISYLVLMAVLSFFLVSDEMPEGTEQELPEGEADFWADVAGLLRNGRLWLASFCILAGYQLFWATYSFSSYMQENFGLTAVTVGTITVAKLWMRPIGAVTAGFIGDHFDRENTLAWMMLAGAAVLAAMAMVPLSASIPFLVSTVLIVGLLTYAIRGVYWATLDSCNVPVRIKGLAIGIISMVGYSPEIYLEPFRAVLLNRYPGKTGYSVYFILIAAVGLLGAVSAWRLRALVKRDSDSNNASSAVG